MTKVVLNNDITKKKLSMCTKLHYLENKYGKIAVYMYYIVIDRWIRIYNPYSVCERKIFDCDIVVYPDNTPDVIDQRYVNLHKSLYDSDALTLDNLRYDDDFIKVVEIGDNEYGDDNLRVETLTYSVASIRIEVDEETNREVAIFNPQWFEGKIEYQYVEYNDAQDIDEVKDLLKDTIYFMYRIGETSTLMLGSSTSNFTFDTGNIVVKTKSRNVYVVDKETFDNWG